MIVGIRPIAVEPTIAVIVALDVEHVRVAVGVDLYMISSITPPLEYSQG